MLLWVCLFAHSPPSAYSFLIFIRFHDGRNHGDRRVNKLVGGGGSGKEMELRVKGRCWMEDVAFFLFLNCVCVCVCVCVIICISCVKLHFFFGVRIQTIAARKERKSKKRHRPAPTRWKSQSVEIEVMKSSSFLFYSIFFQFFFLQLALQFSFFLFLFWYLPIWVDWIPLFLFLLLDLKVWGRSERVRFWTSIGTAGSKRATITISIEG